MDSIEPHSRLSPRSRTGFSDQSWLSEELNGSCLSKHLYRLRAQDPRFQYHEKEKQWTVHPTAQVLALRKHKVVVDKRTLAKVKERASSADELEKENERLKAEVRELRQMQQSSVSSRSTIAPSPTLSTLKPVDSMEISEPLPQERDLFAEWADLRQKVPHLGDQPVRPRSNHFKMAMTELCAAEPQMRMRNFPFFFCTDGEGIQPRAESSRRRGPNQSSRYLRPCSQVPGPR